MININHILFFVSIVDSGIDLDLLLKSILFIKIEIYWTSLPQYHALFTVK